MGPVGDPVGTNCQLSRSPWATVQVSELSLTGVFEAPLRTMIGPEEQAPAFFQRVAV
jgi:hypothetical protein